MKHALRNTLRGILPLIVIAGLAGSAASASAGTAVVTYILEDVWLLPDMTHPWADARQMTGTFEWTYEDGDFENGSGEFTALALPWWSDALPPLAWTIEQSALEITMPGKYHDHGVDVTLRFIEELAPDAPSNIDTTRSAFEIQVGVSWMGHVISGRAVPTTFGCGGEDLDGDGTVDITDLLMLLGAWGAPEGDVNGDGMTDIGDLLLLLGAWGSCS